MIFAHGTTIDRFQFCQWEFRKVLRCPFCISAVWKKKSQNRWGRKYTYNRLPAYLQTQPLRVLLLYWKVFFCTCTETLLYRALYPTLSIVRKIWYLHRLNGLSIDTELQVVYRKFTKWTNNFIALKIIYVIVVVFNHSYS